MISVSIHPACPYPPQWACLSTALPIAPDWFSSPLNLPLPTATGHASQPLHMVRNSIPYPGRSSWENEFSDISQYSLAHLDYSIADDYAPDSAEIISPEVIV